MAEKQLRQVDLDEASVYVMPTGGLSKNGYVLERLRATFQQMHPRIQMKYPPTARSKHPVATGALTIPHVLNLKDLRAQNSIGVLNEDEPYDPFLHPDGVYQTTHVDEDHILRQQGDINTNVVLSHLWFKEQQIVEKRIIWMLKKGTASGNEAGTFSVKLDQSWHIMPNARELGFTVVFTTKDTIVPHEALEDDRRRRRHGFSTFSGTVAMSDDLHRAHVEHGRIKRVQAGNNRWADRMEVYGQFALQYDSTAVRAGIKILPPLKKYFDRNNNLKRNLDLNAEDIEWQEIWSAKYDHVVMDSAEAEVAPGPRAVRRSPRNLRSMQCIGRADNQHHAEASGSQPPQRPIADLLDDDSTDTARRPGVANRHAERAQQTTPVSVPGPDRSPKGKGKARVTPYSAHDRNARERLGTLEDNQRMDNPDVVQYFSGSYH